MATTDVLTKSQIAMTGGSIVVAPADPSRRSVILGNPSGNSVVTLDISGGSAAAGGIPINAGDTVEITGMNAKCQMTALGTNGQTVTVYFGR